MSKCCTESVKMPLIIVDGLLKFQEKKSKRHNFLKATLPKKINKNEKV